MAEAKGGIKTDNWLTNWMIDRVNSGMTRNSETGKMDPGFWSGTIGSAVGLDVDLIGRRKAKNVESTAAGDLIDSSTYTREDLGFKPGQTLTRSGVKSAVKKVEDAKTTKEEEKRRANQVADAATAQTNAMEILGAQNQHSNNQFNATLKSQIEQNAFERSERANERSFNRKENDLNRRQERELADSNSSLQMQMAIMNNDLAEKRMDYDRETARMDKRDRMIAQLMSGLGSLGSAFG